MSSRDSRELNFNRVLYWACPTCNSRMALKDKQAHLDGLRHAGMLRAATQKENIVVTPESPEIRTVGIQTKNFKEFIAEQKQIYREKKGQMIAAAIEERLAREAQECASVGHSAVTDVPRFAPGARFPSRPPTMSELPVIAKGGKSEKLPKEAGPSDMARKEKANKVPKEIGSPEVVKKSRTEKAPKKTGSPESSVAVEAGREKRTPKETRLPVAVQKDEGNLLKEPESPLVVWPRRERANKVPKVTGSPESSVVVKKRRQRRTSKNIKSSVIVREDGVGRSPEETESPLVAKKESAKEILGETESPESPAADKWGGALKRALNKIESPVFAKKDEAKRTPEETESPITVKNNRPKRAPKGESQPPPQPLYSAIEAPPSVSGAPDTTQAPMVVESRSRCTTCNIEMAAKEYRTHLGSQHHLAIIATTNQTQITAPQTAEIESRPASFASLASSELPAQTGQTGFSKVLDFDELHTVDNVSVTSQEAYPPVADDIWTLLFRQSHQEGIKHLENLKRVNKPQSHNRHQLPRKPRLHPHGSRWIRVCQIAGVYRTLTELPAQAWLDAFIALPLGPNTFVTPEEYELACDAFNSSRLAYNTGMQWNIGPLGEGYTDSTQWYGNF